MGVPFRGLWERGAPPAPPVLRASPNWHAYHRGNSGHGGGIKPYAGSQRWYAHTDPHRLLHRFTQDLGLQPEPAKAYTGGWQPGPSHEMKGVLLH